MIAQPESHDAVGHGTVCVALGIMIELQHIVFVEVVTVNQMEGVGRGSAEFCAEAKGQITIRSSGLPTVCNPNGVSAAR